MTAATLLVLALASGWLWRRLRRLERRLEDLNDRAIDWRIELARRQEELRERLEGAAAGGRPPEASDPTLISIRPRPRPEPTETTDR